MREFVSKKDKKAARKREASFARCGSCETSIGRAVTAVERLRVETAQHVERERHLLDQVDQLVRRCRALEAQNDALLARLGEPRRDAVRERMFEQQGGRS